MAGEWRTMTLREANVGLIDCDHRTPLAVDHGYPYVAIPQLRAGRIDLSDVRRITREHYMEWTRKAKPSANDVILSRRCNPGETAVAPPDLEFALGQNLVLLRADGTKVHPPFLRWLVRGPEWWEQINKFINVGAVFDSLKCADIPNFQLGIPPLPEQRAIAHILGTLDDKIELNRRMNETLEAMARALFKSWFVDFDPVRAKANLPSPAGRGAGGEGPHCSSHAYPPTELRDFARALRNNQTDAEHLMWRMLRDRRIAGAKFRRQHPVPPYVLDFYCHDLKLAIELDGGQHGEPTGLDRDRQRDAALSERGITVLRFWNHEVLNDTEAVLEQTYQAVTERVSPSPQTPLPEGEGFCGLPKPLADLFPNSFEDSELGEIPKGWRVRGLDEIAHFLNGLALQKYPPTGNRSLPVIKITQLRTGNVNGTDRASADLDPEYIVDDGDVLFSWSGSLECVLWAGGKGALNQHLFKVTSTELPKWFYYFWIREHLPGFQHIAAGKATTMGHIQRHHLSDAKVVVPTHRVLDASNKALAPIVAQMSQCCVESRTLAALRDTLLPKLISGEIRLKDPARLLEAVVT